MMVAEHCQKRTSTQLGRSTQKGFISDAAKFLNAMQELRLEAHALAAAQVTVSDSDKLFELSQTFKWTSNIVGPLYAVTVLQAAAAFMVCSLGDLMQMTDLKTADACRQRLLSLGQAELQLKYKLDSLLGDHKSGWELIGMTVMRNPVTRVASYAVQSVVSIIGVRRLS